MRRTPVIICALGTMAMALGCSLIRIPTDMTPSPGSTSVPTPVATEPISGSTSAAEGNWQRLGELRLAIESADYYESREGYNLVVAGLILENAGNRLGFLDQVSVKIVDDRGFEYIGSSTIPDIPLAPGFRIRTQVSCEVPQVARGLNLVIRAEDTEPNSLLGSGQATLNLEEPFVWFSSNTDRTDTSELGDPSTIPGITEFQVQAVKYSTEGVSVRLQFTNLYGYDIDPRQLFSVELIGGDGKAAQWRGTYTQQAVPPGLGGVADFLFLDSEITQGTKLLVFCNDIAQGSTSLRPQILSYETYEVPLRPPTDGERVEVESLIQQRHQAYMDDLISRAGREESWEGSAEYTGFYASSFPLRDHPRGDIPAYVTGYHQDYTSAMLIDLEFESLSMAGTDSAVVLAHEIWMHQFGFGYEDVFRVDARYVLSKEEGRWVIVQFEEDSYPVNPHEGQLSIEPPTLTGRITFAGLTEEASNIYIAQADGSDVRKPSSCTSESGCLFPGWSRDGSRIAFLSQSDWSFCSRGSIAGAIFTMAADGTDLVQLTRLDACCFDKPVWSPDDTQVLLVSSGSSGSIWALGVQPTGELRRQSSSETSLVGRSVNVTSCDWSVRGQLVFSEYRTGLCIVQEENMTEYTPDTVHMLPGVGVDDLVWSPDGSKIAFSWPKREGLVEDGIYTRSTVNPEIYVLDMETQKLTRLTYTSDQAEKYPVWSPDGQSILYIRCPGPVLEYDYLDPICWGDVYAMNLDGGGVTRLPISMKVSYASWTR